MQYCALVDLYLLVGVREDAVLNGLCGFHLPGLPAWVPLPSPHTVRHERE